MNLDLHLQQLANNLRSRRTKFTEPFSTDRIMVLEIAASAVCTINSLPAKGNIREAKIDSQWLLDTVGEYNHDIFSSSEWRALQKAIAKAKEVLATH